MIKFNRYIGIASIMPFIWSILSASSNHYLQCLVFVFIAMLLSFICACIAGKKAGTFEKFSDKKYLSAILICNIVFITLNIAVFQSIIGFIILLTCCLIVNISAIYLLVRKES